MIRRGRGDLKGGEGLGENRSRTLIFCVNTKYQFPALNGTADELERYSGGTPTVLRYSDGTPAVLRRNWEEGTDWGLMRYSDGTPVLRRNWEGTDWGLMRYSDGTPVLRRNSGGTPTELIGD